MEPVITNLWRVCKNLFPVTAFAMTSLPSYPGGTCTFVLASTNEVRDLAWARTKNNLRVRSMFMFGPFLFHMLSHNLEP